MQVLQALVLSHLDYCSVVWSGVTVQDSWPLYVHRALTLMIWMSISPGSKWSRDWLHHHCYFWEVLTAPSCLFEVLYKACGLFTVPKSRTHYGRCTILHRAMTTWNSIPHQVTHASSNIWFIMAASRLQLIKIYPPYWVEQLYTVHHMHSLYSSWQHPFLSLYSYIPHTALHCTVWSLLRRGRGGPSSSVNIIQIKILKH